MVHTHTDTRTHVAKSILQYYLMKVSPRNTSLAFHVNSGVWYCSVMRHADIILQVRQDTIIWPARNVDERFLYCTVRSFAALQTIGVQ